MPYQGELNLRVRSDFSLLNLGLCVGVDDGGISFCVAEKGHAQVVVRDAVDGDVLVAKLTVHPVVATVAISPATIFARDGQVRGERAVVAVFHGEAVPDDRLALFRPHRLVVEVVELNIDVDVRCEGHNQVAFACWNVPDK